VDPLVEKERSIMRADIVAGAQFPDFQLSDHTGRRRKLSEIAENEPTVIVLARGSYCPKDRRQHEGLAVLWREMMPGVGYCRLVTISTDTLIETNEFRSAVGAPWPFLSDPRRTVAKDLDIVEYTDPEHNAMVPHTIVCAPGLVVHKIYNGYWFFGRPTIEELRLDLREVERACRWDWDLSRPDVSAAWEAGEKEKFYPYGKTLVEEFAGGEE
jgi:peroxiredoxin